MNFGWHPDRKPFIVLHLKSDNLAQGNAKDEQRIVRFAGN
jgi:hypothetical protein